MAKKLPQKILRTGAFEALVISLMPLVQAMKEEAPVDDGDLKQSIGVRFRRYGGGRRLFAGAGPRKGVWGKKGKRPSLTAHLQERGHWTRKGKKGKAVWVPPNAFMRRAWLRTKEQVLKLFRQEFGNRITAEVRFRQDKKRKRVL